MLNLFATVDIEIVQDYVIFEPKLGSVTLID